MLDTPYNLTLTSRLSRYPQIAATDQYPYMNRIAGDAEYRLNIFAFNAGYEISDDLKIYSFGTYGEKYGAAFENYRVPNLVVGRDGTASTGFRAPTLAESY